MTRVRNSQIDLAATTFYHVINSCIKRSFLCGIDSYSGRNYEHRRQWLINRIKYLSGIYSIDIAAYAIMSNHYHLVLHVDKTQALSWSIDEVIARWYKLFKGNFLVDEYRNNDQVDDWHLHAVNEIAEVWRKRLYDISWFMKYLNEFIAREANKEDNCTGKFWEGRFKSQALLDDIALLSCMAYVDLNPIRAGIADALPTSDFTSIQERIIQYQAYQSADNNKPSSAEAKGHRQPASLLPFAGKANTDDIPFSLIDYLELVDWSSRQINPKKTGFIDKCEPKILEKLAIDHDIWLEAIKNFRRQYGSFAGSHNILRSCAHQHGQSWYKGVG
jgi:REP element-mobilizing transposase RayT